MIDAVMIWNEPNNLSHWDFELDPGWRRYAHMVEQAAVAIASEAPRLTRVLGGISPIDPSFLRTMREHGALDHVNVVAVHGFPLDWNHWQIDEWPDKLAEIQRAVSHPVWVTEVVGGMGEDGRTLVTKTAFRTLQTLYNLGPAPEPNLTVFWSTRLPDGFKRFAVK